MLKIQITVAPVVLGRPLEAAAAILELITLMAGSLTCVFHLKNVS